MPKNVPAPKGRDVTRGPSKQSPGTGHDLNDRTRSGNKPMPTKKK